MHQTDHEFSFDPLLGLVRRLNDGDEEARAALMLALYAELRAIAGRLMRKERPDHTLNPTALIGEVYLRMFGGEVPTFRDPEHFVALAVLGMRRVLVDHGRARSRQRRSPPGDRVDIAEIVAAYDSRVLEMLACDELLDEMRDADELMWKVFHFHIVAGLTIPEVAAVLGISENEADTAWRRCRRWLEERRRRDE